MSYGPGRCPPPPPPTHYRPPPPAHYRPPPRPAANQSRPVPHLPSHQIRPAPPPPQQHRFPAAPARPAPQRRLPPFPSNQHRPAPQRPGPVPGRLPIQRPGPGSKQFAPNAGPGGHILCVAEKPSVARDLSRILSAGQSRSRPGLSRYNPIHDFHIIVSLPGEAARPPGPRPVQFTSVLGHLMQLEFVSPYDKSWQSHPPSVLFHCPLISKVIDGQEPVRDNIAACAKSASALILWLDCDREGENIACEVAGLCRDIQPHIPVYRARFSALIEPEIRRALTNLGPINLNLSRAVDARQEIDLRTGSAFTRLQTLSWAKKFAGMPKVLSYGPCQFPTLGFVVERHLEIQQFVPEDYWNLSLTISADPEPGTTGPSSCTTLSWRRGPLYDRAATLVFYSLCLQSSQAVVESVHCSRISKSAPVPLATVSLQTAAARYLHMGSALCMEVAENLYRRGLISYPRTETDSFSNEFDLVPILQQQTQAPDWGQYVQQLLGDGRVRRPRPGGHDDHAHPPIYPTEFVAPGDLRDQNERRLYEYIVRHFVACCSPDAIGDQTRVVVRCGGEHFSGQGLTIRSRGYLDVYPYERWSNIQLPVLHNGQILQPTAINMTQNRTHPPPYLSEADLISIMDRNGIGTDATIAQHIETIQKRHYAVKRPDRCFVPTALGVALVVAYDSLGFDLSKPKLRAAMEADMKRIALGQVSKSDVVKQQLEFMANVFASVNEKRALITAALARSMQPA